MKNSPLQLDWVSYPTASYEYVEDVESNGQPVAIDVRAEITWDVDNQHMASVSIKNSDGASSPYRFNVMAAAVFSFDLEEARRHYEPKNPVALPSIIAVNVCRILVSGAREYIAMMTSRGPRGSVMIEGIILEPLDIKISSTVEPQKILLEVFKVPEEIVRSIEEKAKQFSTATNVTGKKKKSSSSKAP